MNQLKDDYDKLVMEVNADQPTPLKKLPNTAKRIIVWICSLAFLLTMNITILDSIEYTPHLSVINHIIEYWYVYIPNVIAGAFIDDLYELWRD